MLQVIEATIIVKQHELSHLEFKLCCQCILLIMNSNIGRVFTKIAVKLSPLPSWLAVVELFSPMNEKIYKTPVYSREKYIFFR